MKLKTIIELGPRASARAHLLIARLRLVNGLVALTHIICPHVLNDIVKDDNTSQYYEICVYCGHEERSQETESIS